MFDEHIYKTSDNIPNFCTNYFNCDLKSSNVNKGFSKYKLGVTSKLLSNLVCLCTTKTTMVRTRLLIKKII